MNTKATLFKKKWELIQSNAGSQLSMNHEEKIIMKKIIMKKMNHYEEKQWEVIQSNAGSQLSAYKPWSMTLTTGVWPVALAGQPGK